jgi:hypothetical protein
MQTNQRPWWLTLITGILAIAVGAILLWAPAKTKVETYQLLIALLALYWLITDSFALYPWLTCIHPDSSLAVRPGCDGARRVFNERIDACADQSRFAIARTGGYM